MDVKGLYLYLFHKFSPGLNFKIPAVSAWSCVLGPGSFAFWSSVWLFASRCSTCIKYGIHKIGVGVGGTGGTRGVKGGWLHSVRP